MKSIINSLLIFITIIFPTILFGQATTMSPASFDFNSDGLVFSTKDTSMKIIMRFRMQNQVSINTNSEDDLGVDNSLMAPRRLRLRFGGHLYDRDITFNLQLSFARGDQDFENTNFPNIIRDAQVFYNFSENLQLSFGQTKLPGNRQRVVSSADLQFAERSLINNIFTLDRDFGFQGFYRFKIDDAIFNLRGAFTQGDGRNAPTLKGANFNYTSRLEVLPFGSFKSGGDYFEGDLLYEDELKLSLGGGYNRNKNATRNAGNLGPRLPEARTMEAKFFDALIKYQGFAFYGEYMTRSSENPVIKDTLGNLLGLVYVGEGMLAQGSYCFRNMYEIAARYAVATPRSDIFGVKNGDKIEHITLNLTKYIAKHRARIQFEVTHNTTTNMATSGVIKFWTGRFNTELGI